MHEFAGGHEAYLQRYLLLIRPSVSLSIVCLSSVLCLSVTFVRRTQAIEIFRNISTPFGTLAIYELSIKILWRSC